MKNNKHTISPVVSNKALNEEQRERSTPLSIFIILINDIIQFKKPIPTILYFLPFLFWGSIAISFLNRDNLNQSIASNLINNPFAEELNATTSQIANTLQEDINFISEKVKDTDIFDMTKDEMIEETEKSTFLLEKGKRLLEKNTASQSEGIHDNKMVYFDSLLNIYVLDDRSNLEHKSKDLNDTDELNYEMDQFKYLNNSANYQNAITNQTESSAAIIERNRQKRLALEQDDIKASAMEANAYQQGVEDYYRKQHTYQDYASPADFNKQNNKANPPKNQSKSKLGFHTASGLKNQLNIDTNINTNTESATESIIKDMSLSSNPSTSDGSMIKENKPDSHSPKASFVIDQSKDNIIHAIIDQGQKLKNGNKVQIRVIQDSYYYPNGIKDKNLYLLLPANTLLYGICSFSQSRLKISIPSIQIPAIDQQIYSSNLNVYDMDGMEGIYIDGTHHELTNELITQALSSGSGLGLRNRLGTVSLNMGRKANRNQKVYVPSGYPILLLQR